MEVDPSSLAIESSSCSAPEETFTPLRDKHIKLQDDCEKKIFLKVEGPGIHAHSHFQPHTPSNDRYGF
jgi:hypothetical protein